MSHVKKSKRHRRPSELSNFPPEFYDRLSKIWLTTRALRELDRRNRLSRKERPRNYDRSLPSLSRYARHGGPDLTEIRGWPEPNTGPRSDTVMTTSSGRSARPRRSSAYDNNFEATLAEHGIFQERTARARRMGVRKPENLDEVKQLLPRRRPSLEPDVFTPECFEEFRDRSISSSEPDVTQKIIPALEGGGLIPNKREGMFCNMLSMTNKLTTTPIPDFWDGVRSESVTWQVKEALGSRIIPTKDREVPIVPNFYLEAKRPSAQGAIAARQVLYDGAYGTRAMHYLHNYGRSEEPIYDDKAYTFSATFHDDVLRLYAHHVTPPSPDFSDGLPQYWMTHIKSYVITDYEGFIEGALAFRNLRDKALHDRVEAIATANARSKDSSVAGRALMMDAIEAADIAASTKAKAKVISPASTELIKEYVMEICEGLDTGAPLNAGGE